MGLPWIQIDKDFAKSPAAFALGHALKVGRRAAVGMCAEFWSWAADWAPEGRVDGALAALVIDDVMGCGPGEISFAEAMLEVGLLERMDGWIRICGWSRYLNALKKAVKDAARKRKDRADGAKTARAGPMDKRAPGAGKSQSQSQSQSQKKEEISTEKEPEPEVPLLTPEEAERTSGVVEVLTHYATVMQAQGHGGRSTEKRRELVKDRFADGFTAEQLKAAISGFSWSDWHMGRDPKTEGTSYADLGYCLGSAEKVEKFMALGPPPAKAVRL